MGAKIFSVLSIEPIYECLGRARMLPKCQAQGWEDFWSTDVTYFLDRSGRVMASVSVCDDGERLYLDVRCVDIGLLGHTAELVEGSLPTESYRWTEKRAGRLRWECTCYGAAEQNRASDAAARVSRTLEESGLVRLGAPSSKDTIDEARPRTMRR